MAEPGVVQVTKAKIRVEATPWQRITVQGRPHNHGEGQIAAIAALALAQRVSYDIAVQASSWAGRSCAPAMWRSARAARSLSQEVRPSAYLGAAQGRAKA